VNPPALAIEVAALEKRYGDNHAVNGISLSVATGEVFGLLGPNGAGKTSTVEILEGYRRADAGTVSVLGLDPWKEGAALRPQIGVMLQEGGLYPGVKPLEALRLFAAYYDDPDDPERLLTLVGLDDAKRTYVRRMSGGQQQRLSLALSLIGKPSLVFLDEPTAGMDPHARATTWSMIREMRDRGVTVVLTTHAMDEAEHLCDRVAIIDHGRVVACDTPTALTTNTAADETAFTAAPGLSVDDLATSLFLTPGSVREVRPGDYLVETAATPELIALLATWLRDQGVLISELRAGRRSLEDVFLRLTGEGRPQ
jgi:ABC-2 type transport system ATP-binding protein